MQKVGRRHRRRMLKERVFTHRENRLPKRSISGIVGKEAGQFASDGDASGNIILFKSKLLRLCKSFISGFGRKNNHDCVTIADGHGGYLEFKDNEVGYLESELPNMALQLGLFLDAGLVVSSAFDELVTLNEGSEKLLYKLLYALDKSCKEKNLALINELFIFSQKIRSKALMRFSSLVLDNKTKGSALAEKLDKERMQMQNARLNLAKGKAKEAETKLCFPLMLLLISLITICSAPALMQM